MQNNIKHMLCEPIFMAITGRLLFNLNTQKTVNNDKMNIAAGERESALGYNDWEMAA